MLFVWGDTVAIHQWLRATFLGKPVTVATEEIGLAWAWEPSWLSDTGASIADTIRDEFGFNVINEPDQIEVWDDEDGEYADEYDAADYGNYDE
eukprot:2712623-Prymnesium_polylepis.1